MKRDVLAIHGGTKAVRRLGPYPSKIGHEELLALINMWGMSQASKEQIRRIIRSDKAITGPHLFRYYGKRTSRVAQAENLIAHKLGVRHVLAVNSGTSALIASMRALGVGTGDEVIIPAYTFFATASAVVACNAIPVICEIDDSLNIDADAARKLVTRRTRVIIPVHMRGAPAQMDAIMNLADKKGVAVVEDVAQACGGSFHGRRLGTIGKMGCFSFDYAKLVVSGEGGFISTNDDHLFTRAQSWHDTAACWRPDRYAPERMKGELFCGENYRVNELQGTVAVEQIKKLDKIIARLRRNKQRIKQSIGDFRDLTFRRLTDPAGDTATVLMFFLPNVQLRTRAVKALWAEGIPASSPYNTIDRDWHVFCYWEHILKRKSVARDGLPWSAVPEALLPRYSKTMCPRTLNFLSRAVSVGISPHYIAADCRAIACGINKVLAHLLKK